MIIAGFAGIDEQMVEVRRDFREMVSTMPAEECRAMMERMAVYMETYTVEVVMGRKP